MDVNKFFYVSFLVMLLCFNANDINVVEIRYGT